MKRCPWQRECLREWWLRLIAKRSLCPRTTRQTQLAENLSFWTCNGKVNQWLEPFNDIGSRPYVWDNCTLTLPRLILNLEMGQSTRLVSDLFRCHFTVPEKSCHAEKLRSYFYRFQGILVLLFFVPIDFSRHTNWVAAALTMSYWFSERNIL